MIIWLDAQLSPALAPWIQSTFSIKTHALRDIGLRDATDEAIFHAAQAAAATVMTKDSDFIKLHHHSGTPPQIIWLTCGNTSNRYLRTLLTTALPQALLLLRMGEGIVEISADQQPSRAHVPA
jgi:predicted nuclease of predicted toxin-antitoxin system